MKIIFETEPAPMKTVRARFAGGEFTVVNVFTYVDGKWKPYVSDSYYWLSQPETENVDEFVRRIKELAKPTQQEIDLLNEINN